MNKFPTHFNHIKTMIIAMVSLTFLLAPDSAEAQDYFGRIQGPNGGEITALAINSNDIIYVGTWGGGMQRSDDNGESWNDITTGLGNLFVSSIAFNSDNHVFAGTFGGGVFRSTDNGGTWTEVNNGITNLNVKVVAVNDSGHVFAGTYGSGVFRSEDNGATWTNISNGIKYLDIEDITFARNGNLLVGTWGGGMYRSSNYGMSWKRSNSQLYNYFIHDFHQNSSGEIFAATNGRGIVMSIDHGLSWSEVDTNITDLNTTAVIVSSVGELVVSTRSKGIFWVDPLISEDLRRSNIRIGGVNSFAINSSGVIFAALPISGLMKSTNDGENWQGVGLDQSFLNYRMFLRDKSFIISSSLGGGLYLSTDFGVTWPSINFPYALTGGFSFADNGAIYAATDQGVVKSVDDGATWNATTAYPNQNKTVKVVAGSDNYVYATTFDPGSQPPVAVLFRSSNGGVNWDTVIVNENIIEPIAVGRNGDVYISLYPYEFMHTSDNGANWDNFSNSNFAIYSFAFKHDNEVLAATGDGFSRSTDNGKNWTSSNVGFPNIPFIKTIAVGEDSTIYLAINDSKGLNYTTDDGVTWENYNADLTITNFSAMGLTEDDDLFITANSMFRHVDESSMFVPTLVYPDNNTGGIEVFPELKWNTAENADLYQLEVSFNGAFTGVVESVTLSDTSRKIYYELENNKKYYWRVRAKNHSTLSQWSAVRAFNTVIAPPLLDLPADSARGVPVDPVLSWHPVESAIRYSLQVSDVVDFSNMILDQTDITDTLFQINGLENLKTYYWRVMAFSDISNSVWSEEWSFLTILPPPNLRYPSDKSVDLYPKINFIWDTVETSNQYYIQVAKNADFAPVIYDGKTDSDTSHFFTLLEYNTEYHWRIRSGNDDGLSIWSEAWSFITAIKEPILLSPSDSTTDAPLSATLAWEEYDGADSYHLQFATDADFNDIIIEETELTGTEYEAASLDYYTDYYWRVRVNIGDRSSYWSEVWTLQTMMQVAELREPANGATGQKSALYLKWFAVKGAKWYHLQVADEMTMNKIIYEADSLDYVQRDIAGLEVATTYYWRARAYNSDAGSDWSETWSFTTADKGTSVSDFIIPNSVEAFPNPFNSSINLRFSLKNDANITVRVLNIMGGTEAVIFSGWKSAGVYDYIWQANGLPQGTYFYQVMIGGSSVIKKIKLVE